MINKTDHCGNVRVVLNNGKSVVETNDYYPFGTPIYKADGNTNSQKYKFNGKEFDEMHGLSSLDYDARQYNPALPLWDRVDPMCEKNYEVSPYSYCHNNPVNRLDPDGRDDVYSIDGQWLEHIDNETDHILIRNQILEAGGAEWTRKYINIPIENMNLSAKAYSGIFTDILSKSKEVNMSDLYKKKVLVSVFSTDMKEVLKSDKKADNDDKSIANTKFENGKAKITAFIFPNTSSYKEERGLLTTISNVLNLLVGHEYNIHYKLKMHHKKQLDYNDPIYKLQKSHYTWKSTTKEFKNYFK